MGLGRVMLGGLGKLGMNTVRPYAQPYRGEFGFNSLSLAGAGLGGGAGFLLGSRGEEGNGLAGAGIGATVGALTPFALGTVGALGVAGATAAYKNGPAIGKTVGKGAGLLGSAGGRLASIAGGTAVLGSAGVVAAGATGIAGSAATMFGAAKLGSAIGSAAGPVGMVVGGVGAAAGAAIGIKNPTAIPKALAKGAGGAALRYANTGLGLAGSLLKYTPEQTYFDEKKNKLVTERGKMRLNWGRAGVLGIAAGIVASPMLAQRGLDEVFDMRKGQSAGVQRATPNYLDNAGATGDLVFAMHQNRRG